MNTLLKKLAESDDWNVSNYAEIHGKNSVTYVAIIEMDGEKCIVSYEEPKVKKE